MRLGALALTLIVLALAGTLSAEAQEGAQAYWGRHTPGFPENANASILDLLDEDLLKVLALLQQLQGCEDLECVLGNESLVESLEGELAENPVIDSRNSPTEDLWESIEGSGAEPLLREIGELSPGEVNESLQGYLDELEALYREGLLDPEEYSSALELLRRIAEEKGLEGWALRISEEQAELLRDLVSSLAGSEELVYRGIEGVWPDSGPQVSVGGGLPSPPMPSASLSVPGTEPLTTIMLLVAVLASAAALYYLARSAHRRGILARLYRRPGYPGGLPGYPGGVLGLYWRGVDAVQALTGVSMEGNETHREYLDRVSEALGERREAFEGLTRLYEIARFSGYIGEDAYEEARKYLDSLVR